MIKWLLMLLMVGMVGCSPAMLSAVGGVIGLGGDKAGIESDIRIAGEANDSVVVGERNEIEAENVTITEIIHNNVSWPLIVVAIIGWMLPGPKKMFMWVCTQVKGLYNAKRRRKEETHDGSKEES